ncbi:hypothetical protein ASPWEDRAFT_171345 [Aspergillus wentii DTO 134E9]|uniref:Trichothecene 3-O-acetyltransferase-like N-terminal domain-containing protein n=1 Tax=Aspergillus wentii DTO 134E9 TaxID=1073089 RepID=A0A1L9RSJ5_ASPWE|nr:uncharacterized protein ASPWEDRAFT_171345 [Aspergillus wentii DTO 134E9]OJJ37889.1 hypothetical protein ASPWEDRAFT_171345 [Aspergillus wentii DTO 134E9]
MSDLTHTEPLTPLDASMPRTYIRVLLVFEHASLGVEPIQRLQSGLNTVSTQIPWVAGKIFPKAPAPAGTEKQTPPYPLEIRWDATAATTTPILVDKGTVKMSYNTQSAQGMPTKTIPDSVWPAPGMIENDLHKAGAPVFAANFFRFADRGAGLCVCMHHNVVDGAAFTEIIRLWAKRVADPGSGGIANGSPPTKIQTRCELFSERLPLQAAWLLSTDDLFARPPEYSRLTPALPEMFHPSTSQLFTTNLHWINSLKELLRKHISSPPSTNTILCALLWSTITRVRMASNPNTQGVQAQTTRLITAVNTRQRLGFPFTIPRLGPFNSRDMTITSWADFDLYGVDFGECVGGKPSFVRLPCIEAGGVVIVLPRRRESGDGERLEVVVMLRSDHMERLLRDEMWQTLTLTA